MADRRRPDCRSLAWRSPASRWFARTLLGALLLFCALLAMQLAIFLVQESLESRSLPCPATVTAGLVGQQPVALLGALLLSWLSARLGPAIATLLAAARPQTGLQHALPTASARPPRPPLPPGARLLHTGQQRGPPGALLV